MTPNRYRVKINHRHCVKDKRGRITRIGVYTRARATVWADVVRRLCMLRARLLRAVAFRSWDEAGMARRLQAFLVLGEQERQPSRFRQRRLFVDLPREALWVGESTSTYSAFAFTRVRVARDEIDGDIEALRVR